MIKEDSIEIIVNPNSVSYFNKKGYSCFKHDKINVIVKDLPNGSNYFITSICDNCNSSKKIKYNKYYKNTKGFTIEYFCKKCAYLKTSRTNLEKYGVENYNNREKAKKTNLEKYGVENYNNREKAKKTNLEKYGVENYNNREKAKKTNLEKYGVENPFQFKEIKEKIEKTNLEKYGNKYYLLSNDAMNKYKNFCKKFGTDHYSKTDEFKEKFQKTCMEKWGHKTNLLDEDMIKRIKNTNIIRYGFDHAMKNNDISLINTKSLINNRQLFFTNHGYEFLSYDYDNKLYNLKNIQCGHIFDINYDLFRSRIKYSNNSCLICYPKNELSSIKEKELCDWIKGLGIKVVENDRTLIKKELDIFLPDYNIAIEFNGLYYHSDKFKEKDYHYNKTIKCDDLGIDLLHVWEDDWIYKNKIVKSIILNRLNMIDKKIYGRKCVVSNISHDECKLFLDENHIQGYTSCSIKLGLFYNGEIVSVMTFGKRRINSKNNFELIRFCNKVNHSIIGGASKLFNFFIKNFESGDIVSYQDISIFNGNIYETLGFINDGNSSLNYYWTNLDKRYHRFNFNKKKLVSMGFDNNKTENQIMRDIGYYKVWSCGQIRWLFFRGVDKK